MYKENVVENVFGLNYKFGQQWIEFLFGLARVKPT